MPSAWQIKPAPTQDWQTTASIENLQLAYDVPRPEPTPQTALVRIHAAALNARDMMVVSHHPIYPVETIPYLTPCADGAGIIEAVGPGSKWEVGQKVLLTATGWIEGEVPTLVESKGLGAGDEQGTLREYAVMNDNRIIRAPSHLSYEEMAALPAAAGTAMNALFYGPLPLKRGMTILAQGTGGVSACAIQLASASGATVVATSSSDKKLAIAKSLGATHLINYRTHPEWAAEVLRVTQNKGVDHVLDVAGAGTIEQSLKATRHGGLVSLIGFLSGSKQTDLVPEILFGAKSIRGIFQVRNDMAEAMVRLVEDHNIHPPVAKIFEWEKAKEAFAALVNQSEVGKIVIKVGRE